jgi:uncharacterized lipoprotein YddW (UPF0748 family)
MHAWLNALTGWGSGNEEVCELLTESDPGQPRHILLEHPDWSVVNSERDRHDCPNGEEYVYLSPAIPGVRDQLARVAADIASRYAVRGIHLDRVRYPGPEWSYDRTSLDAFGNDPRDDPEGWEAFRREQVNQTVREVHAAITAVDPTLTLSAAVWPIYQDNWDWNSSRGYDWYFQDPRAWARDGFLDVAAPMTYDPITPERCGRADWACLLDDHVAGFQAATGRHLYIGVNARNGAEEALREIDLGRERGVDGFALYSFRLVDEAGLWDRLADGPFRERAAPPEQPWKTSVVVGGDGTGGETATPFPVASPVGE